ncbi:MAG: type II toxin-antitoxin system HicB family antitoxin [bacterium]|nr:type II toxin-antitoxin system HicB family antitoxin [bacterium]
MRYKFTAVFKKSGKWYVGWIEEVPGVNTQGKSVKEVKENLKEALRLVLETNRTLTDAEAGKQKLTRALLTV